MEITIGTITVFIIGAFVGFTLDRFFHIELKKGATINGLGQR